MSAACAQGTQSLRIAPSSTRRAIGPASKRRNDLDPLRLGRLLSIAFFPRARDALLARLSAAAGSIEIVSVGVRLREPTLRVSLGVSSYLENGHLPPQFQQPLLVPQCSAVPARFLSACFTHPFHSHGSRYGRFGAVWVHYTHRGTVVSTIILKSASPTLCSRRSYCDALYS